MGIGINLALGTLKRYSALAPCVPVDTLDGNLVQAQTFSHPADGVIAWTQTTLPSAAQSTIFFRQLNSTNRWRIRVEASGNLSLAKIIAGVGGTTSLATGVAAVSSGDRIVIVCNGSTIQAYSGGVLVWTYENATELATQAAGEVGPLGTAGVMTDLKTWSLACISEEVAGDALLLESGGFFLLEDGGKLLLGEGS